LIAFLAKLGNKLESLCFRFLWIFTVTLSLLFFICIIWTCVYDFYDLHYYDTHNNHYLETLATSCSVETLFSETAVCNFYDFTCVPVNGWSQWSNWSICNETDMQSRSRSSCVSYNESYSGFIINGTNKYQNGTLMCSEYMYEFETRKCPCLCSNTCPTRNNGICEDEGDNALCEYGTDCNDCGSRGNCTLCASGSNYASWVVDNNYVNLDGQYSQIAITDRQWIKEATENEWNLYLSKINGSWEIYIMDDPTNICVAKTNASNFGNEYNVTWIVNNTISNSFEILYQNCEGNMIPTSTTFNNFDPVLTKLNRSNTNWIKFSLFGFFALWLYMRWRMVENKQVSNILFTILFFTQNMISYTFRDIGFVNDPSKCGVLYLPFFSAGYIEAIATFLVSCLVWFFLIAVVLKRQQLDGDQNRRELVIRTCPCCVRFLHAKLIHWISIAINYLLVLLFVYVLIAGPIWLFCVNFDRQWRHLSLYYSHNRSAEVAIFNFFLTTLSQYYANTTLYWISPFVYAAIVTNLLNICDIWIIVFKFIIWMQTQIDHRRNHHDEIGVLLVNANNDANINNRNVNANNDNGNNNNENNPNAPLLNEQEYY